MKSRISQPWIPVERIDAVIQLEPALLILSFTIGAWLFWKLLLRKVSEKRHQRLRGLFANLSGHLLLFSGLLFSYVIFQEYLSQYPGATRFRGYLGLAVLVSGAVVIIKNWRIIVLEYLFFGHMREGVPVLLVNITTLVLSILLGGWIIAEVFEVQLAPLVATSAVFSIIVGMALQDTLGNMFAGVALQFDKPYEIGDWIEVNTGSQRIVGQVQEITWRATVLIALSDEAITIPNRVIAQAQINNYSLKTRPIIRSQIFRLDPNVDIELAKSTLLKAVRNIDKVRHNPAPMVLITETHDSWLPFKLIYFVDDFGSQWSISDEVISKSVTALNAQGIRLSAPRLSIESRKAPEPESTA
jgi:small-conductance mechanosensitive channel